jgi:hypothetical protein
MFFYKLRTPLPTNAMCVEVVANASKLWWLNCPSWIPGRISYVPNHKWQATIHPCLSGGLASVLPRSPSTTASQLAGNLPLLLQRKIRGHFHMYFLWIGFTCIACHSLTPLTSAFEAARYPTIIIVSMTNPWSFSHVFASHSHWNIRTNYISTMTTNKCFVHCK